MKLVTVSTALRTALYWLLDHIRRPERQSEPERFAWERERRTSPPVFIPAVYEPPEPRTGPIMQPPHGRYFLQERKRFGVVSIVPTEPLAPPPKWTFPDWLNDLQQPAPKQIDPLDDDPTVKRPIVKPEHEGRGKAS